MSERKQEVFRRIMRRIHLESETGCWVWTGPHSGNGRGGGYPRMSLEGQTVAVHRVLWVHYHGYLPIKKQLDHTCRNRMCVNPDHLEVVTNRENNRRRARAAAEEEKCDDTSTSEPTPI